MVEDHQGTLAPAFFICQEKLVTTKVACTAYTNAHIVHVSIPNTGEKTAK